ncbi:MAG: hypothetical protein ACRD5D_06290, partial [Candidatus Polarisedimenticolia bacterium]
TPETADQGATAPPEGQAADLMAGQAAEAAPPAGAEAAAEPDSGVSTPAFRPETAAGAVPGVPAPTNTLPIVAVANYFTELPGIDIAGLKAKQRERFLQQVNSEMCPCGCKNDTLARCYVNDPRCPTVRGIVQTMYDEVKAAP